MKRNYKIILVALAMSVGLWSFIPKQNQNDPEKDKLLIELLAYVVETLHYQPLDIDDDLSKGIFKDYIEALDPSKRYFLQSDIDEFSKYELQIDDQIKNKDLTFFDLTYNRIVQRMKESETYYKDVLANPIDYNVDENYNADFEKLPYSENKEELKERWRKQIKFSTLASLVENERTQEELQKNRGKSKEERLAEYKKKIGARFTPELEKKFLEGIEKGDKEPIKSFAELEKTSRDNALKSLNENFDFIKDLDRDDWFSVYLNAIASRFDPHTSYFAPIAKDRFDQDMSGKLEGIGARLQKKGDFTEITELISGGPAWRGKELEAGDKVLKVAQGSGEAVDVVGMRIDDVIKKIKGPKGTEVRLTVKKTDGSIKVITIIRDEVEIEETYVKSSIVEKNGLKYGIIYLPKFYIDFEDANSRDAAKDVALEVERLKTEGVKGIIMDIRDNGGGSLKTVVDIGGLFIEKGPIVQVKSANGNIEPPLVDKDPRIQWDGPLVIMINEFSASASEILAAAMQDYKRAVVVGSKQSYGKGTVQRVYDFDDMVRNNSLGKLGSLKLTIQKFYRINGGSTQLEGVASDVPMPDRYAYLKMGEKDSENAMPFDKIPALNYSLWNGNNKYDVAIANSKKRIESNSQMRLIDENAKWLNERNNTNVYSLQINKYKNEIKKLEDINKKFKPLSDYTNNNVFNSLPYELEQMKVDKSLKEKRDVWHESLSKDIYIEESINILNDLQNSSKSLTSKTKNEKLVKS